MSIVDEVLSWNKCEYDAPDMEAIERDEELRRQEVEAIASNN
jgi:hypothetical protein